MSIDSSEIIVNRPFGQSSIKIRERHVDHLGKEYFKSYVADVGFDVNARLAENANAVDNALINQEIQKAINTYESGGDPLHFEASPDNWQPITPDYQTWEQLAGAVTINFLERENMLELDSIYTTIVRMSSQTKATLWGMSVPEVSAVNSSIQDARNTQVTLDAYSPFFVEGVKV